MNNQLNLIITFVTACIFSVFILLGFPIKYIAGFILFIIAIVLYFKDPLLFFVWLLFLRAGIDRFLMTIRFNLVGIDLGFGGAVSLFIIISCFIYMLTPPAKSLNKLKQPILIVSVIFCFIILLSFFNTEYRSDYFKTIIRYLSILAIFVNIILICKNENVGYRLTGAIILSVIPCLLIGLLIKAPVAHRFSGAFGHPNILAFYLLIIIGSFVFALDKNLPYFNKRIFKCLFFVILFFALLSTQTRSGWIASIIMLTAYSLFFKRKFFIPLVAIIILTSSLPFVQKRISSLYSITNVGNLEVNKSSSLSWRLQKWSYLMEAIQKRPILGYGIDSAGKFGKDTLGAHNDYLKYSLDFGLFGAIFYFLPFIIVFCHSFKFRKCFLRDSMLNKLAGFFIVFIPSFLIMSITENLGAYIAVHWYLWVLFGIYFSLFYEYSLRNSQKMRMGNSHDQK